MKYSFLAIVCCFFLALPFSFAQIKQFSNYQRLTDQLEKGYTDIDYTQFRKYYFESEVYANKKANLVLFDSLKTVIDTLAHNNKYFDVIKVGKQLLSMDYTCMMAHQYLRQMYSFVHDSAREVKHKAIQYGLLRSMIGTGDGLTLNTAWEVFQTEEEYAILAMIGTKSVEHEIVDAPKGVCDKITVETKDGKQKIYFFRLIKTKPPEEKTRK
jgi:hypothetical protein